jgi:hypothetical protein
MSLAPPKLLSYYSNKINIYKNDCYIPLPSWNSCPPPPQIYIMPEYVYPPAGPYAPPIVVPIPQPTYYAGELCGTAGCGTAPRASCGPCGR